VALRQERDQETPDFVELRDNGRALVFEETEAALVVRDGCEVFGAGFAEELRGGWRGRKRGR
jgi:hypothetical protein